MSFPTHIIAEPGDLKSLCGVRDPLPVVALEHAAEHDYAQARCETCFRAAGLDRMLEAEGQETLFAPETVVDE